MKFSVLWVQGGTEPALSEAYDTPAKRDEEAKQLSNNEAGDADGIFWLDVNDDGVPSVGPYTDEDLEEKSEE